MTDQTAGKPKQFDGGGFESGDFSPAERASMRHMFRVVDGDFQKLDYYELAGVKLLGRVRQAWWLFPIAFGVGASQKTLELLQQWGLM